MRALAATHEAEMRRAGKEVVRLQKLLKRRGGDASVVGGRDEEFAMSKAVGGGRGAGLAGLDAEEREDDESARSAVAPISAGSTTRATSRAGKIVSSEGGIKPSWLGAIDRSGDDLNRVEEEGGAGLGGGVGNILRRSQELRLNIGAAKDGVDGGGVKWGASMAASMEEGKAAGPTARTRSPPKPTRSSGSPARVTHTQRNAPIGGGGATMSVKEWQDGLNLKESSHTSKAKQTSNQQLDKYIQDKS
jgi:hypothetical protein